MQGRAGKRALVTGAAGGIGGAIVAASRAGILIMAAAGCGAIVNTASCWGGLAPGPNHPLYCMTKSAVAQMTT